MDQVNLCESRSKSRGNSRCRFLKADQIHVRVSGRLQDQMNGKEVDG